MTIYRGICSLAVICILCSCNGLPGSASGDLPPLRPPGTVSGYVVDGALAGAEVTVYAFENGAKGERLGGATTGEDGSYSIDINAKRQVVLIEAMGGHYIDDATGGEVTLRDGQVLRSLALYRSGEALSVMVTPLTHVATALAQYKISRGAAVNYAIEEATAEISAIFGVKISLTRPRDITDPDNIDSIDTSEYLYGFQLAGISSWAHWAAQQNNAEGDVVFTSIALAQVMYNDVYADGLLDGRGYDKAGNPTPLAFGVVQLHRDIYRIAFSQHLMAMVAGEKNRTALTVRDFLTSAHNLATSRDALFGGDVPDKNEKPQVVAVEPEGMYHNRVFDFPVAVRGLVGVQSVTFYIDGDYVGEAADPQKPSISIDTRNYHDGDHTVAVTARDILGKKSEGKFLVRFDNTAPFVNVTSSPATNTKSFQMQGNYGDNGAGIRFISVAGQPVALSANETWQLELDLAEGRNVVPIVVMDRVGNEYRADTTVDLDIASPLVESTGHSQARFSRGDGRSDQGTLGDHNEQALYLETSHADLNGIPITRTALDNNGIPYFAFRVRDPEFKGAFTPEADIEVRMRYLREPDITGDWRELRPVAGEYLIPLAAETLHPQWYRAAPAEEHVIRVSATDRAGNSATHDFSFKTDFFVAPFTVQTAVDEAHRTFDNTPFSQRRELHGMTLSVISYSFTNTTGKSFFLSLDDDATHSAELLVEQMVREHQARLKNSTEWRIGPIRNATQQCPSSSEWRTVTEIFNYTGNNWRKETVPPPGYGNPQPLSSDAFPPAPPASAWTDVPDFDNAYLKESSSTFWYRLSYEYDYVQDPRRLDTPASVRKWSLRSLLSSGNNSACPDVRYFQQRTVHQYESLPGYPKNNASTFIESDSFITTGFVVEDITANTVISPYRGWYRIPADHMVTIHKQVTTPRLNVYDNTDVANPDTFRSYDPRNYDKRISWSVNRGLTMTVAHDAGDENVFAVSSRAFQTGQGTAVYQISRDGG